MSDKDTYDRMHAMVTTKGDSFVLHYVLFYRTVW